MVAFSELAITGAVPISEIVRQELKATIWRRWLIGSIDLINQILTSPALAHFNLASIASVNIVPERILRAA